jgi:DNA polymerase I-like protein with 3'-5' exonuclease and polymerase domains
MRCPSMILEYRGLAKLRSTYTEKLPEQINPDTGRVHTSYHQAVAATGRLSSMDPNLQNIPIRSPEGRRIRQAFIAAPGHRLLAADYSQIELRIMAHLSGDQGLLRAFAEDRDIHQATAAEVFGVALDQVSGDQRRSAKAINFGLIYGMSAFGLARQLGVRAARRKTMSICISRAIRACGATWSPHASRRGAMATSKRCLADVCTCRTSARAIASYSSTPNAARSTRRCRARLPTSSSAR